MFSFRRGRERERGKYSFYIRDDDSPWSGDDTSEKRFYKRGITWSYLRVANSARGWRKSRGKEGEGRSERGSCRVTKRLYIFPVDGTRDGEGRGGKEDDNRTGYDV